jgi:hypothetical protein
MVRGRCRLRMYRYRGSFHPMSGESPKLLLLM